MPLKFAEPNADSLPLHVVPADGAEEWVNAQPGHLKTWVASQGFKGRLGQVVTWAAADGALAQVTT